MAVLFLVKSEKRIVKVRLRAHFGFKSLHFQKLKDPQPLHKSAIKGLIALVRMKGHSRYAPYLLNDRSVC